MRFLSRQQAAWIVSALLMAGVALVWWPHADHSNTPSTESTSAAINGPSAVGRSSSEPQPAQPTSNSPWSALPPNQGGPSRPSQVPALLELPLLQASLSALQTNGADLSAAMRSRHVVQVTDPRTADELLRWGRQQGFTMSSDPFNMHGGIQAQMIYFDRRIVPDAQRIQLDGLAILQALTGMDTAQYDTWMGEINRP